MAVADSVGEGRTVDARTSSTTVQILPGRIVEWDTSGYIVLPTTTPIVDRMAGVTVDEVAARTTATYEPIIVQQTGLAAVVCAANSQFTYGGYVRAATAGTGAGYASTVALATTITSTALAAAIGKVVTIDATTEGTTVVVQLGI